MDNPLKNLRLNLPPEAFRDLKVRLLLLGIFGGSVALAWWSIDRLPAWEKRLELQSTKISALEDDIQKMEQRWNAAEAEQIAGRFKQSQELLWAGHDQIAMWQTDLKKQADQFALSINAGVTRTQDCPLPGKKFTIASTAVDLRPITPGIRTNSPYARLLTFAQYIADQKKRVDLVELTANGGSNSVSEASMGLRLWSLENSP
jgi:hypothetical protein